MTYDCIAFSRDFHFSLIDKKDKVNKQSRNNKTSVFYPIKRFIFKLIEKYYFDILFFVNYFDKETVEEKKKQLCQYHVPRRLENRIHQSSSLEYREKNILIREREREEEKASIVID